MSKLNISDGVSANGIGLYPISNGASTVAGEHPYGEHPSRTLFVRNINSNVEDTELKSLFEIRETPHKRHHKFIEFYDVRATEAELRALNRSDIAGKRIKLEPSRPVGARRKVVKQRLREAEIQAVDYLILMLARACLGSLVKVNGVAQFHCDVLKAKKVKTTTWKPVLLRENLKLSNNFLQQKGKL